MSFLSFFSSPHSQPFSLSLFLAVSPHFLYLELSISVLSLSVGQYLSKGMRNVADMDGWSLKHCLFVCVWIEASPMQTHSIKKNPSKNFQVYNAHIEKSHQYKPFMDNHMDIAHKTGKSFLKTLSSNEIGWYFQESRCSVPNVDLSPYMVPPHVWRVVQLWIKLLNYSTPIAN